MLENKKKNSESYSHLKPTSDSTLAPPDLSACSVSQQ